jgi:very-short-patch-repair endonuclease/DNA polymerase III delta prime subunit
MSTITSKLDISRQTLLDLSTRNRLIHVPQNKQAKVIDIVDELSTEVFRLLVKEQRSLTFLPGREKNKIKEDDKLDEITDREDSDYGELPQAEDDEMDERGVAKRHSDYKLQTLLTSEGLQKRLLSLFYDSKTFEEEQGVNILYLAIGILKWFEDDNSEVERYAPLVLIPVSLERGTVAEKFKIKWRHEEAAANLSLQAKMNHEFGIVLPDLPDDDDIDIAAYFKDIKEVISTKRRFAVEENKIVLGFFSFAKFLMYRDLDPANWPSHIKLDEHPLISGLIQNGFPAAENMIHEDANVDEHLSVDRLFHVVDADSSQTLAIEEVRRGRNLVIQGPPGTGKSQTITNIIASAVKDEKKVLFVAEKMAALEVVQRRMNSIGLGPLCFELHSSKSNKRAVLEELKRTKELSKPKNHDIEGATIRLQSLREKLNNHCITIHKPNAPSGFTAYNIIGNLVSLKEKGIQSKGIVLTKPEEWTLNDLKDKQNLLSDVVSRVKEIGIPAENVWVGVCRAALLPNEYERLVEKLQLLSQSLQQLQEERQIVANYFSLPATLQSYRYAAYTIQAVLSMPACDKNGLTNNIWIQKFNTIEAIVEAGKNYETLKNRLSDKISGVALTTDLSVCRQNIAMYGESLFKIFNSHYKGATALLKSVLAVPIPKDSKSKLALLDEILQVQELQKLLKRDDQTGNAAFGSYWEADQSNWSVLTNIINWRRGLDNNSLPENFFLHCSKLSSAPEWEELNSNIVNHLDEFESNTKSMFNLLQLDMKIAFEADSIETISIDGFANKIKKWSSSVEQLSKWINFKKKYDLLSHAGLEAIATQIWDGTLDLNQVNNIFTHAYYDSLAELAFSDHPTLRDFDGFQQSTDVLNFRENDKYRIEQARVELRGRHFSGLPHSEGGIGPLGILNGEFAKKRNHLSIRHLIKKAGPAIQALKPVFMMSPLSVAQFLEPGGIEFDLLVIDEASQIEPVDALGAVARAKQIVVVGDTQQLPPTKFFSRVAGNISEHDEGADEEETTSTEDVESILSLCVARGLPQRMLRWHYRSKHQSLIAVSNKQFYDSKLFIVPSPYDAASGMGLKFNYISNGVFDRGGASVNKIEAVAVAKAVIKHAKEKPQYSLGVGTFSIKQKEAIRDELELLRKQYPETEAFFTSSHPNEPFFVKNLENIQGDERDVIFISVGYGKNENGYMAMSFGPIGNDGGERRLNVLISRAKRKCELFASITADDIDLERAKKPGVAALKLFMKFAETGKLDYGKESFRAEDSIFEEQVAAQLRAYGFDVRTQIGIAGFFVDIAIVDPERPGRFLLGIECDGASYHSSRSARDRDRLRQAVLEDHGWVIHRIWSTDWFYRPQEQLEKVLAAIEGAKEILASQDEDIRRSMVNTTFEIATNEDTLTIEISDKELSISYVEANFSVPVHQEPHEISDNTMVEIVTKIVEIESPIHESEIVTRVRSLWNLARAGNRIQTKVKKALDFAVYRGTLIVKGEFYLFPGSDVQIRDRGLASASVRKIEGLPPQEIRKAITVLIENNFGATMSQVTTEVARLLGYKSTSPQLKEIIETQLSELVNEGVITKNQGFLILAAAKN